MADFDDHNDKIKALNLVQDAVVPLSKTVSVAPREFLAARRPRVARQRRDLCKRYRRMVARGKTPNIVVTAIAREILAFLWAIAREVPIGH
jgi:hypothetical protein